MPGIYREIESVDPALDKRESNQYCKIERDVYREFGEKARRHLGEDCKWLSLSYAQHYGTPTRLLDWSLNRLIGLYFAVSSNLDEDGALWCLDMAQVDPQLPLLSVGRRAYRRGLRSKVMPTDDVSFFQMISGRNAPPAHPVPQDFFAVFQPPDIDGRMTNQQGVFSVLVTFATTDESDQLVIDQQDYIRGFEKSGPSDMLWKFTIPSAKKEPFRRQLEEYGVDASFVFPDLLGLGEYFKRKNSEMLRSYILDDRTSRE